MLALSANSYACIGLSCADCKHLLVLALSVLQGLDVLACARVTDTGGGGCTAPCGGNHTQRYTGEHSSPQQHSLPGHSCCSTAWRDTAVGNYSHHVPEEPIDPDMLHSAFCCARQPEQAEPAESIL